MASGLRAQVWPSSLLRTLRPRPRVWGDGRGVCPTSSQQGTSGAPPRRPLGSILPHPRPHPGGSPAQPCPGRLCSDCAFPICASYTKCSEAEVMARGRHSTLPHRLSRSGNARTARPRGACYGRVLIGGRGGACVCCRAGSPREEPDASRGPGKAERVDESWAVAEPAKRIRQDRASGRGGIAA